MLQHKSFSATTNHLSLLAGPCRHANALLADPPLFGIGLHLLALASSSCSTLSWSATCSCTFFAPVSAIAHASVDVVGAPLFFRRLAAMHEALCSQLFLPLKRSASLAKQVLSCSILQVGVRCAVAPFPRPWQCDHSCFPWCRRCASVCLPPA